MSTMNKLLTTVLVLNLFMYIAVNFAISADGNNSLNPQYNFHFNGDLIDSFLSSNTDFDQIAQDTKDNWTNYDIAFEGNFTQTPDVKGGNIIGEGVSFFDSIAIAWSFVKTLGNIMIAPLTLFFNFNMPVLVGLMIGIPYFFLLVLTFFSFIRGVAD